MKRKGLLLTIFMCLLHFQQLCAQQLIVFNDKGEIKEYYTGRKEIFDNYQLIWKRTGFSLKDHKKDALLILVESEMDTFDYLLRYKESQKYNTSDLSLKDDLIIEVEADSLGFYNGNQYYLFDILFENKPGFDKDRKLGAGSQDAFINYQLVKMSRNAEGKLSDDYKSRIEKDYKQEEADEKERYKRLLKEQYEKFNAQDSVKFNDLLLNWMAYKNIESKLKDPLNYHSTDENVQYNLDKKNLEIKIAQKDAFYTSYYKDNEVEFDQRKMVLDSLLSWKDQLFDLEVTYQAEMNRDKVDKTIHKVRCDSLFKTLKFNDVKKKFLADIEKKTSQLDIIHAGVVKRKEVNEYNLVYNYTRTPIEKTPFSTIGLSSINELTLLTKESAIYPIIANIDGQTYRKKKPKFSTNIDSTTNGSEDDLKEDNILGMESIDLFPDNFGDLVGLSDDFKPTEIGVETVVIKEDVRKNNPRIVKSNFIRATGFSLDNPLELFEKGDFDTLIQSYIDVTSDNGFKYEFIVSSFPGFYSVRATVKEAPFCAFSFKSPKLKTQDLEKIMGEVILNFEKAFYYYQQNTFKIDVIPNSNQFITESNFQLKDFKEKRYQNNVSKFLNDLSSNISFKLIDEQPDYYDVLLKPEKNLVPLKRPNLTVSGENYSMGNTQYTLKSQGELERTDIAITHTLSAPIVTTNLPLVRKNYRFSINMGAVATQFKRYNYTIQQDLSTAGAPYNVVEDTITEWGVVPTFFFSYYLWKHDVYSKLTRFNWYKRLELNIGIDYKDKRLIDNLYIGTGWSPHRLVHLVAGYRFGEIYQLDYSKLNPFDITESSIESSLVPQWKFTNGNVFVGVNLGIDFIPKMISNLF